MANVKGKHKHWWRHVFGGLLTPTMGRRCACGREELLTTQGWLSTSIEVKP